MATELVWVIEFYLDSPLFEIARLAEHYSSLSSNQSLFYLFLTS